MNNAIKTLRWIGVLPVGALAAYLAYFVCSFLYGIWNRDHDYLFELLFLTIFSNGVFGFVFVYVGSMIAPSYKKTTSVVLATIGCVFGVILTLYTISKYGFSITNMIGNIATIIGAIGGSWMIHEMEDDANK